MVDIVGIIVDGGHGAQLVIAEGEHTLLVHVGETHGTHHGIHATLASPLPYGVEKGVAHLGVVDEIEETETHVAAPRATVDGAVDDGCHAPHRFSVAVGHEALRLTEIESGVDVGRKGGEVVAHKSGHIVGVALVEVVAKLHELAQLGADGGNLTYFYTHRVKDFTLLDSRLRYSAG